jgi:pyruvate/2-oxoglutarate dehydrogenase complex dihydrolipoamide dehydrogenase (E3) component
VLRWSFADNDRAHTERDTAGEVKIITGRRGRIVGAMILGAAAGDRSSPGLAIAQSSRSARWPT